MNIRYISASLFGFKLVKCGQLAFVEKNSRKFFLKCGRKFSLKVMGVEFTNKGCGNDKT